MAELTYRDAQRFFDTSDTKHAWGAISPKVLLRIQELKRAPAYSVETGCGLSTVFLSRISRHHVAFCLENESHRFVVDHPAFDAGKVEFVFGPTQRTLPAHTFDRPIDVALMDGPHAFPFPYLEYFYFYPQLAKGGLLVVDNVEIPTVGFLARFLRDDAMFDYLGQTKTAAFFQRTDAPLVPEPFGEGWSHQRYNRRRLRLDRRLKLWLKRHLSPEQIAFLKKVWRR